MKQSVYGAMQKLYNYFYVSPALSVTSRFPVGTNVFEREWDALLLLDTCRVDALAELADEYAFLPDDIDRLLSVGSHSREWMANTFTEEYADEIAQTAYVSANGHAKYLLEENEPPEAAANVPAWTAWRALSADDLLHLEHLWMFGDDAGHVPPESVTDRAIAIAREQTPSRLIIHYSQPHEPYAARVRQNDGNETALEPWEESPFDYLIGGGSFDRVWESYLENLRYVLDSIELLLRNLDAPKTIISADHGEAFGEMGFYAHQVCAPVPEVRYVPWAKTTATDTGSYEPTFEKRDHATRTAEEQLRALGYKA